MEPRGYASRRGDRRRFARQRRAWPFRYGRRREELLLGTLRGRAVVQLAQRCRSEEHTSELQSLMRISYAVFFLKKKKQTLIVHNLYSNKVDQHIQMSCVH